MGSGERLTALIGALGADGAVDVIQSIRPDTIPCMYGSQAKNVNGFLSIALESLRSHLASFHEFSGWSSPVGGFYLGPVAEARSDTLQGVFRQAIQMTASLSALDALDESEEEIGDALERDISRQWGTQIRSAVTSQRPDLSPYFNCVMRLRSDSRETRVGFVGLGLAAHFGIMRPHRISSAVREARARFWELQQIKQTRLDVSDAGLLLCAPRSNDPLYSEDQSKAVSKAINGLRQEAGNELWLKTAFSTEEAANTLIQTLDRLAA